MGSGRKGLERVAYRGAGGTLTLGVGRLERRLDKLLDSCRCQALLSGRIHASFHRLQSLKRSLCLTSSFS